MGQVVNMPPVPDGEASMQVYLVKYDENQWFRYDESGHKFCYEQWIRRAAPLGCKRLVVQLIPDPLFPRSERELPYVYYQQDIIAPEREGFKCLAFVRVISESVSISVSERARIERALQEYPNGTKYEIYNYKDILMWHGKVIK